MITYLISTINYKNGNIQLNYNIIGKRTIGKLKYFVDGINLFIPLIYVSKGFRNKRIGTTLLNRAIMEGINNKCESISLFVFEDNKGAIRFYKRNGMFIAMNRKNRNGSNYYLMTKKI